MQGKIHQLEKQLKQMKVDKQAAEVQKDKAKKDLMNHMNKFEEEVQNRI